MDLSKVLAYGQIVDVVGFSGEQLWLRARVCWETKTWLCEKVFLAGKVPRNGYLESQLTRGMVEESLGNEQRRIIKSDGERLKGTWNQGDRADVKIVENT